ncbi:hypothetical protein MOSE0_K10770 [Monosporozyma servazzii]
MRRGPVIGNVLSITSSYGFVVGLSRFLSSRLPYNDKYPWHKDPPCPSPSQRECLLPDLSQDIITAESELLNNTRAQYILGWVEKGNNWVDKMDVLILYIVGIFCLLSLPIYDLLVGRLRDKANGDDGDRDMNEEEELSEEESYNAPIQEEAGDPPKDSNKHIEDVEKQFEEDLEPIEERKKEVDEYGEALKMEENNVEEEPAEATMEPAILQQDINEITPNPNISLEEEVFDEQENQQELVENPEQNDVKEQNDEDIPPIKEESSLNIGVSSPVSIPKVSQALDDSLSLRSKSDVLNPNSQSSSSSFLQFSPSKASHFDAQVDTKNAYSQPFKFK